MRKLSVQQEWCLDLPLQQQSILLLAARGPDGVRKQHPGKDVQRAYRACVLVQAKIGRALIWGEQGGDDFMSLAFLSTDAIWPNIVNSFFLHVDELPHHFLMHLMHGAEILGYKHPDMMIGIRWREFYNRCCDEMHVRVELPLEMNERLSDWNRVGWHEEAGL